MKDVDSITSALAKKGVDSSIDAATGFLSRLLGPACDEAGLILKDKVSLYRLKCQLRMLGRAQEMLTEAGIAAQEVPLRTLLPLLEGASLENDTQLVEKWAGLLANAAAGNRGGANHPGFPRILQELAPLDAAILDRLNSYDVEQDWNEFRSAVARQFSISIQEVDISYDNLFRLGLCRIRQRSDRKRPTVKIGAFGVHFLRACSGPGKGT